MCLVTLLLFATVTAWPEGERIESPWAPWGGQGNSHQGSRIESPWAPWGGQDNSNRGSQLM